jgi:hypothetical protein
MLIDPQRCATQPIAERIKLLAAAMYAAGQERLQRDRRYANSLRAHTEAIQLSCSELERSRAMAGQPAPRAPMAIDKAGTISTPLED